MLIEANLLCQKELLLIQTVLINIEADALCTISTLTSSTAFGAVLTAGMAGAFFTGLASGVVTGLATGLLTGLLTGLDTGEGLGGESEKLMIGMYG